MKLALGIQANRCAYTPWSRHKAVRLFIYGNQFSELDDPALFLSMLKDRSLLLFVAMVTRSSGQSFIVTYLRSSKSTFYKLVAAKYSDQGYFKR